jgi:hypothetical protein
MGYLDLVKLRDSKVDFILFQIHFCLLYQGKFILFSVPANLFYYYRLSLSLMVMISIQLHICSHSYSFLLTLDQATCKKRDALHETRKSMIA